MEFTPHKAEQILQSTELQEKEQGRDGKYSGKLIRKNL